MKHALMVVGGWEDHTPEASADVFTPLLEEAGFEVQREGSLEVYLDASLLNSLDLIVPIWTQDVITSEPLSGTKIEVEIPTHVAGTVNFASGAVATVVTTFDVWAANLPRVEIYGAEGSLSVPDPNTFGGPIRVWTQKTCEWTDVPITKPFSENSRGLGVADMADAIVNDRPHSASGELGAHVLEIMHAFGRSSDSGKRIDLSTTCERPPMLGLPNAGDSR